MRRNFVGLAAVAMVGLLAMPAVGDLTVNAGQSTEPWLGYMNVSELPVNGGALLWGSPWGIPDLAATFDDPNNTVTLAPNTIGDADPYWYIGGGAPGSPGNKIMEANLYQEIGNLGLEGQTVTFVGEVLSNTFTAAHESYIFVKDYAPDYSSFTESKIAVAPGPFSVDLVIGAEAGRHVQWGFQTIGANVWITDVAPFGNAVIATVPEPATLALLAMGGVALLRRRSAR